MWTIFSSSPTPGPRQRSCGASWPPSWRPGLRQHVHLLPPVDGRCLTPDFRVLDESEAALLRERALEASLEDFYRAIESGDGEYALLADTLGAGRDDRALARLIPELHGSRATPTRRNGWPRRHRGGRTSRSIWRTACTVRR